jgi:hypothetical protein
LVLVSRDLCSASSTLWANRNFGAHGSGVLAVSILFLALLTISSCNKSIIGWMRFHDFLHICGSLG